MSALSNLKKNITPRARLMIGSTIVVVVGIVGFSLWRVTSSATQETQGVAQLESAPTTQNIHRDTAADQVRFGDDTAVGQLYKADEQRKANEALSGVSSHVDSLRVNVPQEKVEKVEPKPAATSPSNLKMLIEQRQNNAQQAENKNTQQRTQAAATFQENPWKAFLETEGKDIQEYATAYAAKVDQLKQNEKNPMPKASYDEQLQAGVTSSLQADGAIPVREVGTGNGSTSTPRYLQYLKTAGINPPAGTTGVQGNGVVHTQGKFTQSEYIDPAAQARAEDEQEAESAVDYPSERIAKASVTKQDAVGEVMVGQTFYSVLQIGVDTDEISPVRAVMVQKGMLEGAVLTGEPARTGEKAKVSFTNMSWKGKSYKIDAIALDPETYRSGLADGVDRHTFERYSKLMIASFVDGYAESLQNSQTTTNTDGSQSTIRNSLPNAGDQMKVGVGKVGEKFSPIFEREFDRPPTVTVEPNKSIVIMFMSNLDLSKPQ